MKTFSKLPSKSEQLKEVDCPICERDKFMPLWFVDGAYFVKCQHCGLVLQNPRPIPHDLAIRYDEEYCQYEILNEERFFQLMKLGLDDVNFFSTIVPDLGEERRILDIGCATGRLLQFFKLAGWETTGVEICSASANYGNKKYGVNIHIGDITKLALPTDHFSLIHASHLIEHVDNPSIFARKVASLLAKNGVFICVTTTIDGMQARLFGQRWRSVIPDHVTLFSRRTLKHLLGNAGLSVERIQTWGGLAVGSAPTWLKVIADVLAKKLGFGDVLLVVARKR